MQDTTATAPNAPPLLSVQNLSVSFPGRRGTLHALDRVSFDIARGEVLGVVGESGAGKSLTGQSIIGLLQPPGRVSGGEIHLDGERIDTLTRQQMKTIRGARIGMVFQDPLTSLNPLFPIGEQIIETIQTHLPLSDAEAKSRAISLLEEVGLPAARDRMDAYPHQLSGGMRQRVVIALALCADPEARYRRRADDGARRHHPGADDRSSETRLRRNGGTAVILITHDMGVIAEMADRVQVNTAGRRWRSRTAASMTFADPHHPYTEALISAMPERATKHGTAAVRSPAWCPARATCRRAATFGPRCRYATERCTREAVRQGRGIRARLVQLPAEGRPPDRPPGKDGGGAMTDAVMERRAGTGEIVVEAEGLNRLKRYEVGCGFFDRPAP
jgi:peptide/nickel transport system ATP-binding protein